MQQWRISGRHNDLAELWRPFYLFLLAAFLAGAFAAFFGAAFLAAFFLVAFFAGLASCSPVPRLTTPMGLAACSPTPLALCSPIGDITFS